ncbi:response regulator [Desulfobulbus rhabdoformis]|jgi:CheY-like chemotaxis protein|uniref:response regulator n=1 Tax=Desulfobulbus rhabdoformis TaxID=34032 RepID=UPI00196630D8|nr:response regulator [Desulfobulbus rhabdoformis]MBM9616743.1 response regulator [Desulfobulbus rhabdoformis]
MTGQENHRSILVVDDNPDNLRLLEKLLTEHHYKVRLATSGSRALATVRKEAPDLILLDIMMPEMDGFEVCRQLKSIEQTAHIPIIFISAVSEIIDKVKAFSLGAVDYILKPFQEDEVLARVKTHLTLSILQRQLEKKNAALEEALAEIKILRGIIPICASCKKIRNDDGYWQQIESYIREHSDAQFSHSICEECAQKLYSDFLKGPLNS